MPETIKNKITIIAVACMLLGALLLSANVHAQSARSIERRADAAFEKKDFYTAAKLYSVILYDSPLVSPAPSLLYPFQPGSRGRIGRIRPSRRNAALYKLAESYRLYNHFKEAQVQYEQYIATQDSRFPQAGLGYGLSLLANNEPLKAVSVLNDFLQKYRVKDAYAEKARQGVASAKFVMASRAIQPRAVISKLQATVSADGSDFALEKINDSVFWFTTSRHELNKKQEKIYPVRLYAGNFNKNTTEKITALAGDLNMATPSLSSDGLTAYFTGWKENEKTAVPAYAIFSMSRSAIDSPWKTPVILPAPVNITGYHTKQPFITRDGNYLLFASNQPGGAGKFDIWVVTMNGRIPAGKAVNAGTMVNTPGDEVTPFYDADSARLYFSSDGMTGMGGLDIYQSAGTPASNQWSVAGNLGAPLNSVRDDQYYRRETSSETAYLSSDRASSCCLEIFKAVAVKYTDTIPADTSGRRIIIQPRPDATAGEEERNRKRLMDSINAITLERFYVHYNFASAGIRSEDHAALNSVITQLKKDPSLNILVASFTDCIGTLSRNELWARKRSESVKAYLVKNGISASRINIDFFGKKHFILPCREGRAYNRAEQIANRRSDLILTREANPKWRPSGNELDIDPASLNPLYRSVNTNFDKRSYVNPGAKDAGMTRNNAPNVSRNTPATVNTNEKNTSVIAGSNKGTVPGATRNNAPNASRNNPAPDPASKTNRSAYNRPAGKNNLPRMQQPEAVQRQVQTQPQDRTVITQRSGIAGADSGVQKLPINSLLDFTPRVKTGVVAEMTRRIPRKPLLLYSVSDSVRIDLYDNGVFDYDTVSVIYNKQLVTYKQVLQTNKPITFYVKLSTNPAANEMILFAENLGFTPPNSALMVITDGENKRTEVNVTSDLEHNTVIYFIKVKKEKQ